MEKKWLDDKTAPESDSVPRDARRPHVRRARTAVANFVEA